jgi:hypothetical protein
MTVIGGQSLIRGHSPLAAVVAPSLRLSCICTHRMCVLSNCKQNPGQSATALERLRTEQGIRKPQGPCAHWKVPGRKVVPSGWKAPERKVYVLPGGCQSTSSTAIRFYFSCILCFSCGSLQHGDLMRVFWQGDVVVKPISAGPRSIHLTEERGSDWEKKTSPADAESSAALTITVRTASPRKASRPSDLRSTPRCVSNVKLSLLLLM